MTSWVRFSVSAVCLAFVIPVWSQNSKLHAPAAQTASPAAHAVPSPYSPEVLNALGIVHPSKDAKEASLEVARIVKAAAAKHSVAPPAPNQTAPGSSNFEGSMMANAPLSAAIATTTAGNLNQVLTMGDWDGKESLTANHEGVVTDFTTPPQGFTLTRTAISEHTIANGFNEDIFYYGDSFGNVYVNAATNLQSVPPHNSNVTVINLPTVLNAFGSLFSNDQIVVTGLCVNPVADLTSFANVNGSFSSFGSQTGEMLYVTFWDTGGGLNTSGGVAIHSGLLAFPIADMTSGATAPPGILSESGFPVQVGGAFGVFFSTFANVAGCAADDDGNVYFQQVDLVGFTGGNIVKAAPTGTDVDRSLATDGFTTTSNLNPTGGSYGTASGPVFPPPGGSQINTFTNYSGTSTTFGNIVALASGPGDALYAAVARSLNPKDSASTRATEGLFENPSSLGPTPSMIVSFSDYMTPGSDKLPVYTGFATSASTASIKPGVNNFRAFVLGTGPTPKSDSAVFGTSSNTLKLDMQIDDTIYSGLAVDEARQVYVISGGTPAGVGLNPSPSLGEIMIFPDNAPADRRADYVDLRKDGTLPNPPSSGANAGDGKSDRYDHIFVQAPRDSGLTPIGLSGLSRGFLLYLNRTAANPLTNVPNGMTQDEGSYSGPINFNDFDPSHQVAGGDLVIGGYGYLDYEYLFGADEGGSCTSPWTQFYLNASGSITFGAGDTTASPTTPAFLEGLPRIAGAWNDLDTSNRILVTPPDAEPTADRFPVQALGFAGINNFKVRWIGVPDEAAEAVGNEDSDTFSIYMFDDGNGLYQTDTAGTGVKGPTDERFIKSGSVLTGYPPRPQGSAKFDIEYGANGILGDSPYPSIVGYTIGDQPSVPNGVDIGGVGSKTDYCPECTTIGNGTQGQIFQHFGTGFFDLRFEGSAVKLTTPSNQKDPNNDFLDFAGASCSTLVD
ncbi:MAG: hypothetical protein ABSF53_19460 [Terracidiphilus sp.]|jgi:hypothetical protein